MTLLTLSCFAFFLLHLGISSTPLRVMLLDAVGEGGYLGLYSLLAIGSLGSMIYVYASIEHTNYIWLPSPFAYNVTKVILLFSILLLVLGTMTRNPTSVKMEDAINEELPGGLKITRHPIQWSILLYAIGHMISNGDQASIMFFGTLALLSGLGTVAMDKRKRETGLEKWHDFYERTSNIPLLAIVTGKTRLQASDINWLAVIIGLALYGSVYWLHNLVSGGASLF